MKTERQWQKGSSLQSSDCSRKKERKKRNEAWMSEAAATTSIQISMKNLTLSTSNNLSLLNINQMFTFDNGSSKRQEKKKTKDSVHEKLKQATKNRKEI